MSNVDSDLVAQVTNALLNNRRTKDAVIDVSSQGGVVTLSGTVSSHRVKQAAEEIARQQEGVITVVNDLSLQAGEDEALPIKPVVTR
jgi:hyperosmotically inducible protein